MEKRKIWGENIPYNTGKPKAPDMVIRKIPKWLAMIGWVKDIFGTRIARDTGGMDTFTYLDEIKTGKASASYDDAPTLTPFLSPGSDTAVIIAPGGGFCNQSRDREGYDIAAFLNRNGINAFVLDYRLNPYRAPVCYLDMQRAIRYARYHAREYGIASDKIGTLGFSAGGYLSAASLILLGDKAVEVSGYVPDAVDAENGAANFVGLIYPVVDFDQNQNMLALLAGKDFYDPEKRPQLQNRYSLTAQLQSSTVPQFLCYGSKDMIKGQDAYAQRLEELHIPHKTLRIEGAGHGFALENKKYAFWAEEFAQWVKDVTAEKTDTVREREDA